MTIESDPHPYSLKECCILSPKKIKIGNFDPFLNGILIIKGSSNTEMEITEIFCLSCGKV